MNQNQTTTKMSGWDYLFLTLIFIIVFAVLAGIAWYLLNIAVTHMDKMDRTLAISSSL